MTLHPSRKTSLRALSRELENIAQLSVLTGLPLERQLLARHTWNEVAGFTEKAVKNVSTNTFSDFLVGYANHPSSNRERLCPSSYARIRPPQIYSRGSELLNKAGIDIQSLDIDMRESVCDFICSLESYHSEVHSKHSNKTSLDFSSLLISKRPMIQRALLNTDPNDSVDEFAHELMKSYLPNFDLKKITFRKSQNYDNVIYEDPDACLVLKSLQSALKFDLKSLGIDTFSYHQAQDIADAKRKNAESILSRKGTPEKASGSSRVGSKAIKPKGSFSNVEPQ